MDEKRLWLETDYFENFRCKGGACRNSCCEGWHIAVGMKEYFDLIGMDCSEELHHRLECAFRVPENPSPEHFRVISPNWMGRCPMHDADGLCMLQRECGEAALPEICRVYPRSLKNEGGINQACCSASCEAVVELLLQEEKLEFCMMETDFKPEYSENSDTDLLEIGPACMKIIRQREINMAQRIAAICRRVCGACETGNDAAAALEHCLQAAASLAENSAGLHIYGGAAVDRYASGGYDIYLQDITRFETSNPDWQRFFENLFANHMLYMDFPCVDGRISEADACAGLCMLYGLLRVICAAWWALHPDRESMVDAIAGIFRLVEHAPFYYNVHVMDQNSAPMLLL